MNWQAAAEFLATNLRLRSFPIGVKFLRDTSSFPEKTRRPSEAMQKRITLFQELHGHPLKLSDPLRPFSRRLSKGIPGLLKLHEDLIERLRILSRFNQMTPHVNDLVDVLDADGTLLFAGTTGRTGPDLVFLVNGADQVFALLAAF